MHVDCALQNMFQKLALHFFGGDGYPSNSRHHIQMNQSVKCDFENESYTDVENIAKRLVLIVFADVSGVSGYRWHLTVSSNQ